MEMDRFNVTAMDRRFSLGQAFKNSQTPILNGLGQLRLANQRLNLTQMTTRSMVMSRWRLPLGNGWVLVTRLLGMSMAMIVVMLVFVGVSMAVLMSVNMGVVGVIMAVPVRMVVPVRIAACMLMAVRMLAKQLHMELRRD